jgi:hypothetical protein
MPRVFGCIAVAHAVLLVATGVLGLVGQGVHTQRHVVLAIFTLVLGCLLQILVFMYFAVSGKMMRQAIHLGRFDPAPLVQLDRRRRGVTIVLAVFMASVLFSTATGAAHWRSGQSGTLHLLAAGVGVTVQLGCWFADFLLVAAHSLVFDRVMREYGNRKIEATAA